MIEQIKKDLEFSKQWWGSAQEGEPIAQDEIEIVKEMNGHVQYLLNELEKSKVTPNFGESIINPVIVTLQHELWKAREERDSHQRVCMNVMSEHAAMKEALEWYGDKSNYQFRYEDENDPFSLVTEKVLGDAGERAQSVLSTLSQPKTDEA